MKHIIYPKLQSSVLEAIFILAYPGVSISYLILITPEVVATSVVVGKPLLNKTLLLYNE